MNHFSKKNEFCSYLVTCSLEYKKSRAFFETATERKLVFDHILTYGRSKGIHVDFVNGYKDHVHVLLALGATQNFAESVKLLKGESSHWLKQQKVVPAYFAWQTDYFAVSLSESVINRVRNYIENQQIHHCEKSFADEYEEFVSRLSQA